MEFFLIRLLEEQGNKLHRTNFGEQIFFNLILQIINTNKIFSKNYIDKLTLKKILLFLRENG